MTNKFLIKFDEFEGPLDVLLELFKKNKLEIIETNIEYIVSQYLLVVETIKDQEYGPAIEYLEFAAELILYKSRKILTIDDDEQEEAEPEFDDLIARILEYKRYREVSKEIQKLEEDRNYFLSKEESDLQYFKSEELGSIELEVFLQISQNILKKIRQQDGKSSEITKRKELNVQEYLEELKVKTMIDFEREAKALNKTGLITFFLAVLELLKIPNWTYYTSGTNIIINCNEKTK